MSDNFRAPRPDRCWPHISARLTALAVLAMQATASVRSAVAQVVDAQRSLTVYSTADPATFDPQRFIAEQRMGYNPQFAWQVPGFGVVREVRELDLQPGVNNLQFTDVAEFIDPTTVSFTDLTDAAGTAVLEQNFVFDLVSPEKLLDKYIGRDVSIALTRGEQVDTLIGTLLSSNQGRLVLRTPQGVRIVNGLGQGVQLGDLPGELMTRPTLVWKVQAAQGGRHQVRTAYQTDGITWRADYHVTLNADDTHADVGAWVSLMNLSGASYPDTRLKLIAGDVQRFAPQGNMRAYGGAMRELSAMSEERLGFQEKSFFEYHLYTLPRRTDVAANTTQQITLFPTARGVNVERVLVYYGLPQGLGWSSMPNPQTDRVFGSQSNKKVDVYVRFKNEPSNRMGMPLPRGKVRIYKQDDADGALEFVGEDVIDHTPRDETVLVKVGQSFDVVGERVSTDFTIDNSRRTMTESFRIQLRNHKAAAQRVVIKENLYRWTTWEIVESSDKFDKRDARTIHYEVDVPADGEKTVTYTVRYTW